jgi:hypothetical protein
MYNNSNESHLHCLTETFLVRDVTDTNPNYSTGNVHSIFYET